MRVSAFFIATAVPAGASLGMLGAALVVSMLTGCTAAQREAFRRELEQQAGELCLEHDSWQACLKKCDAAAAEPKKETPTDAPSTGP